MSPFDYIIQILTNFRLIKIFFVIYPLLLLFHYRLFKRVFNGLTLLVFTSSIVFSVIIDFFMSNEISIGRLIYFIFSEVFIYVVVLLVYKAIITKVDKDELFKIIKNINDKYFFLFVAWMLIGVLISLANVSFEGSSRIAYQDNRWYSFVRMISQLIDPVVGLLTIFNLYEKKKVKFTILFLFIIFSSAAAGSKSGFVFAFAEFFLVYRDLIGLKYKLSPKIYVPIISLIFTAALLNFIFLGVDRDKVFERTVHYAEATIMVYPSKNPCVVCQNQSMIGLIHRGVGRIIKDPSSLNIDNLFGFALSKEFYGDNTFTGPNARIGAYAICAFPGYKIYILYLVFAVFLLFNYTLLKLTGRKPNFLYLTSILLVFHAIQHFVEDYNTAMSDLSLIFIILLFGLLQFILFLDISNNKKVSKLV